MKINEHLTFFAGGYPYVSVTIWRKKKCWCRRKSYFGVCLVYGQKLQLQWMPENALPL